MKMQELYISIDGNSIVSDQNGRAIHSIYSGFYPVHISHERYADKAFTVNISQDTLIYIELDQTLADAKFVISMDNARLSGASVSIAGKSEITSTIGMANFYNLKTDTVYLYRIENLSELLAEDTVVFHTDSTLRLYYTTGVYTGQPPEHNLHLYPNPAGNHIRVTGVEDNCEFQIRDINGRMLLSGVMKNNGIIDVSNLASGIYFLKSGQYPTLKFTLNK